MRLWSIHPKYLDARGLVALWRESLLAREVLEGRTVGYRNHPQLERFRRTPSPVDAINQYLEAVFLEGERRGYKFDRDKLRPYSTVVRIPVTRGQLEYETRHLLAKLAERDPERYGALKDRRVLEPHPIFFVVEGDVEPWERRAEASQDTSHSFAMTREKRAPQPRSRDEGTRPGELERQSSGAVSERESQASTGSRGA